MYSNISRLSHLTRGNSLPLAYFFLVLHLRVEYAACSHIEVFVSSEEIFVPLWHDLTAGLIYEMVTASQLSITLNIKNKCI